MNANYQTAAAIDRWSELAPAVVPTRGLGVSAALLGMASTVILRARQLLEASKGTRREPPGGGGSETPPEDHPHYDSIWDDPVLWMLMIH